MPLYNATLWCSVGTGAASLLAGCVWDACFSAQALSRGAIGFMTLCVVLSVVSFGLSIHFRKQRDQWLADIESEIVNP